MKYWDQFQKDYGGMTALLMDGRSYDEINEFIRELQDKYTEMYGLDKIIPFPNKK